MKTKHTGGKWYIDSKDETKAAKIRSTIHKEGQGICLIYPNKEWEANAELIVKSPAMLKVLIKAQKRMEQLINFIPTGKFRNQLTEENIEILQLITD